MYRPGRALLHPLWLAALTTLVINDHLLKRWAVEPSWLVGKLSDVAGLLIAPALLATLARMRTRRGVLLAWIATGIGFAAIKTVPMASALYERLLSLVAAQNVVDPSDLVALLALPLGFAILVPAMQRATPIGRGAHIAAIAGALSCLATSAPPAGPCPAGSFGGHGRCTPAFTSRLFFTNVGPTTATLSVRFLPPGTEVRCRALAALPPERRACGAREDDFGPARIVRLQRGESAPLDPQADGSLGDCAVALVRFDDWRPPVLIVRDWPQPTAPTLVPYVEPNDDWSEHRDPTSIGRITVDAALSAVSPSDFDIKASAFVCAEPPVGPMTRAAVRQ